MQKKTETAAEYTRRMLRGGVRAKKSLGQNFLIDDDIISRIVEEGVPGGDIPTIEIGPGLGGLTRVLLTKSKHLWAVELDKEKIEILRREFQAQPLTVLHRDALNLNLKDLWGEEKGWLIGNLPYYITNPLLMHFLEQGEALSGMTVMVQKEVADRMTSKPGSKQYGILSIAVQISAEAEKLFEVPPSAFLPQPKVTSTVVRLRIRTYPGFAGDPKTFFRVVKAAFAQRRKTLLNTLSAGLGLAKEEMAMILKETSVDERLRPEDIGIPDYQRIARAYVERNVRRSGEHGS